MAGPGALLRGAARGETAALPALPVQYADYTLWQQAVLGEEADAGERDRAAAWRIGRQRLADLPEQIELPVDRPRPAVASHRGGSVPLVIERPNCTAGCSALARAHGASLFMVLQAALAALLTRLGGGTDIAIGSPVAGRGEAALDDLIGFFVNTLVLRTDTSGNPSFASCCAGCGPTTLRPMAMPRCRSSGWWRCSTRRARCRGTRCSR